MKILVLVVGQCKCMHLDILLVHILLILFATFILFKVY